MIDSHCHLADEAFHDDLEAVITRARDSGVDRALCVLDATKDSETTRAVQIAALWQQALADKSWVSEIYPGRTMSEIAGHLQAFSTVTYGGALEMIHLIDILPAGQCIEHAFNAAITGRHDIGISHPGLVVCSLVKTQAVTG